MCICGFVLFPFLMRLLAIVEYDGTDFSGFQLQVRPQGHPAEGQRTVQAELERAVLAATGQPARIAGSGRTDTGVHAAGQVIHFDSEAPLAHDPPRLLRAVNAHLPADVALRHVVLAPPGFHARFDARSRTYCYRIWNSGVPSPLLRRHTYHVHAPLDVERMADAVRCLLGVHDFVAFSAQHRGVGTRRRVLHAAVRSLNVSWASPRGIWHNYGRHAAVSRLGGSASGAAGALANPDAPPEASGATGVAVDSGQERLVEIEIEADAFLRHMVRRIAGTLLRVGWGRLAPAEFGAILASGNKELAGPTAPAQGLCLERVTYNL
ncbi:MAG: tRNA pseudouridine synthase A [Chloroflexi bacterium]|nr:tRNA pseudouridine synthase A [Chloroflexota bacterium]